MSNKLLVSTRKGLFCLERQGNAWSVKNVSFLAENVTLALAHPSGTWFAALNLGHFGVKLKSSTDEGETWTDCGAPAYPEGEIIATADGKPPTPATLKLIWALAPGGANQPKRVWAGTAPGGLFKSDDLGATWELVRGLWDHPSRSKWFGGGLDWPGIHSIVVDPRDSKHVLVGVSCAGVWETLDDGATWNPKANGMFAEYMPPEGKYDQTVQDPHMMVSCPTSPDAMWVQHHNGIFRTTDGGANWNHVPNAKPTGFGFGVAVHPNDPNTAWFVPAIKDERRVPKDAKLVVSRTRDGGETFEELCKGLPQESAYDIVYRHALDVDAKGDGLAIGSTTGGLWISANQGDSWQQSPVRFPPIHAVKFLS